MYIEQVHLHPQLADEKSAPFIGRGDFTLDSITLSGFDDAKLINSEQERLLIFRGILQPDLY